MAKFDSKSFNPQAFGAYVNRIPNVKKNELADLFGQPVSYVCPELERRITEALLWDSRIESVTDFQFDLSKKGVVSVRFKVQTAYGAFEEEKNINV